MKPTNLRLAKLKTAGRDDAGRLARYIADKGAGRTKELLFDGERAGMTAATAAESLLRSDDYTRLIHLKISIRPRAFVELGETDDDRRRAVVELTRETMRMTLSLSGRRLSWIAGCHFDTDIPHVHVVIADRPALTSPNARAVIAATAPRRPAQRAA